MELKINPEYSDLVLHQSKKDYEELKDNIREFGQYEPISYNTNNEVLNGHHRFKICEELEIDPKIEDKPRIFETEEDEKLYVIDTNLQGRVKNDYVRAVLALMSAPILEAKAKKTQGTRTDLLPDNIVRKLDFGYVRTKIAKRARLSEGTIAKVQIIEKFADQDVKDALIAGETTINEEYQAIAKKHKKKKLEDEPSDIDLPDNCELYNMDFRNSDIPDNSIDLIFTDPPYGQEAIPLYEDLAEFASRKLKDGASLVTYTGQMTLDKVMQVLGEYLDYWWIISIKLGGSHQAVHARKVFVEWKPLLWFVKKGQKPNIIEYLSDHIDSKPVDKVMHDWEQSVVEADHVIQRLTVENQIVLDPFMGTGTTGKATLNLSRKFIGIEIDNETSKTAQVNLLKN